MTVGNITNVVSALAETVSKTNLMVEASDALEIKIQEMKAKIQDMIDNLPKCDCCGLCAPCCDGDNMKVEPMPQGEGGESVPEEGRRKERDCDLCCLLLLPPTALAYMPHCLRLLPLCVAHLHVSHANRPALSFSLSFFRIHTFSSSSVRSPPLPYVLLSPGLPDIEPIVATMEEKRQAFCDAWITSKISTGADLFAYTREAFPDLVQCVTETVRYLGELMVHIVEGKKSMSYLGQNGGKLCSTADMSVEGSGCLKTLFTEVGQIMSTISDNIPTSPF